MEFLTIIEHPRFVGLWTYRPHGGTHGGTRQFCVSVMVNGETQETEMFDNYGDALQAAGLILKESEKRVPLLRRWI